MAVFRWRSEEYVLFYSILRVLNGITGIAFCLAFILGYMQKMITPRQGIVTAVICKLLFFLLTYPWPFLSNRMSYETLGVNGKSFLRYFLFL